MTGHDYLLLWVGYGVGIGASIGLLTPVAWRELVRENGARSRLERGIDRTVAVAAIAMGALAWPIVALLWFFGGDWSARRAAWHCFRSAYRVAKCPHREQVLIAYFHDSARQCWVWHCPTCGQHETRVEMWVERRGGVSRKLEERRDA